MFTEDVYRVIVEVVEVQGLVWPSPSVGARVAARLPNPYVEVVVGGNSQWTATQTATASCCFNRMFIFADVTSDDVIEARVYHKALLTKELIGAYSTTAHSVRAAPAHRLVKTLFPLLLPEHPSEPRGFVRLSIYVLKPGEVVDAEHGISVTPTLADGSRVVEIAALEYEFCYLTMNIHLGQGILQSGCTPDSPLPSPAVAVEFMDSVLRTEGKTATRTPAWNETLRFPAAIPCARDRIVISLVENNRTLGVSTMSFHSILRDEWKTPTWLNFYTDVTSPAKTKPTPSLTAGSLAAFAALFEIEEDEESSASIQEYCYLGRILLSASCVKHRSPSAPHTLASRPVAIPPSDEYVLWIDLAELAGVDLNPASISIQLNFGPEWNHTLNPSTRAPGVLLFDEETGHLPQRHFILPSDLRSCYNFIIQIFHTSSSKGEGWRGTSSKRTLIAYKAISAVEMADNTLASSWIDLIWADKKSTQTPPELRSGIRGRVAVLGSFLLRSLTDVKRLSLVRPEHAMHQTIEHRLSVCCYEAFSLPVLRATLPSPRVELTLGGRTVASQTLFHTIHPDWNEVLDVECGLPTDLSVARDLHVQVLSQNTCLGELSLPTSYIASEAAKEPQWYLIQSKKFPGHVSKLLLAFHLVQINQESQSDTEAYSFDLPYTACDIRLFVLGCRLFSDAFGDTSGLSSAPEIQLEFGRVPGNPNSRLWYGTCEKAVRGENNNFDYFHPIEVKCFLPTPAYFQNFMEMRFISDRELGSAYVHLNPCIDWLPESDKIAVDQEFQFYADSLAELVPQPLVTETKLRFLSPFHSEESISALLAERTPTTTDSSEQVALKSDGNAYISPTDIYTLGTAHGDALPDDPQWVQDIEEFTWLPSGGIEEHVQEELSTCFERTIGVDALPYRIFPILGPCRRGALPGRPDIVGLVKVRCRVVSSDAQRILENKVSEALHLSLRDCPKLKTRIHVLSGMGLVPSSLGHGTANEVETTEWYLQLANARDQGTTTTAGVTSIVDSSYTAKGFAPDFYRSFELDTVFPRNALLTISVVRVASLWGNVEILGRTLIDLETRWAHATSQPGVQTPIELRTLRNAANEIAVGKLKCRIEILTEEEANFQELVPISLPPPQLIQVRVVIWKLRGVPIEPDSTLSLYVIGLMGSTDSAVGQETDTHWNSSDGTAVFNWRMLFDVAVPSEISQLRLQVWSRNLLSAHESIAETVIELSSDLLRCKTLGEAIRLERASVRLSHPSKPSETMGFLDTEICLVPAVQAKDYPVGLGREEPNRDPFLPAVTENRNYITTSALGRGFFAMSEKVAYGAQICTWVITVVVLLTLFYLFSKFFL